MGCDLCADPEDGSSWYPMYGVAPHECYWRKGPQFTIGQSTLVPISPEDCFVPELEAHEDWSHFRYPAATGVFYCPNCHADDYQREWNKLIERIGPPPAAIAIETRSAETELTGREYYDECQALLTKHNVRPTLSETMQGPATIHHVGIVNAMLEFANRHRTATPLPPPAADAEVRKAAIAAVEELANTRMDLPLERWSELSGSIMAALTTPVFGGADLRKALEAIANLRQHSREDDADNAATMEDMARRALATPPSVPAQGWLPIETAPRDGSDILLIHNHHGIIQGRFASGEWSESTPISPAEYSGAAWVLGDDLEQEEVEELPEGAPLGLRFHDGAVTHWMPLPATPPSQDQGESR